MSDWVQYLPLVLLLVLFWFLVLRPARARQRSVVSLQDSLEVGQQVMLTSGLYGELVALSDETVELRVAADTVVTVARLAVARVVGDEAPADGGEPS